MLNLKLQYFGHLIQRTDSLKKKNPDFGKIEGRRRKERWSIRWLDGITNSMVMSLIKFWGVVKDRKAYCSSVYGVAEPETIE